MKNKFANALSLALIMAMLFTSVGLADVLNGDALVAVSGTSDNANATVAGGNTVSYEFSTWVSNTGGSSDNVFPGNVNVEVTRTGDWLSVSSGTPGLLVLSAYEVIASGTVIITVPCNSVGTVKDMFVTLDADASSNGETLDSNKDSVALRYRITAGANGSNCAPSDTTAPDTIIDSGTAALTNGNSATFTFHSTEANSTFACSLDGGAFASCSSSQGYSDLADGSHSFAVRATDAANNTDQTPATHNWTVDTLAPTVSASPDRPADSNGWYNHAVIVTFSATDATCEAYKTYSGPDSETASVSGTCTDAAGNVGTGSFGFKYDATAPTISGSAAPAANNAGWNNSAVAVTFTCNDNLSGVASCGPHAPLTNEGADQFATGNVFDIAGNSASATVSNIDIDKTKPTISGAASTSPNAAGWYNNDVFVDFTCEDILSGVASCGPDTTLFSEGADQSVTGNASDNAGNSNSATVSGINIDKSAPSISCTVSDQAVWYGSDVTVNCTTSDGVSGLANPADASFSLTTSVLGGTETDSASTGSKTVSDNAGNSAVAGPYPFKVDKKAPSVSCGTADGIWHATDVSIGCTASDGGSGLASPADASFSLSTSVPAGTEDANASTNSAAVADIVGNSATAGPITGNKVDKKAPFNISFVGGGITDGGSYYYGFVPAGPSSCTAEDSGSGLASCAVTGGSTSVGAQSHVATATDNVGNSSTATLSYTVLAWTLSGFYQPVDMPVGSTIVWNTVKGGSTVPLKFNVYAGLLGQNEQTDVSAIKSFTVSPVTCANGSEDTVEFLTTGGTSLRYDTTGHQFVQNWQTPRTIGCYKVTMTTKDLSTIIAYFKTK